MNRGRSITLSVLCGGMLLSFAGVGTTQAATVEERLERLEAKTLSVSPGAVQETGNMVSFRGGWAGLVNDRSEEVFTDVFGTFNKKNNNNNGYYVGAALDMVMSKNLWGMLPGTWALGEIGVEYKRWNSKKVVQAVPTVAGQTDSLDKKVKLTMLTVSISPKIMFMEKSRFRPWIIPVGLDFHVISPPSNSTTYLDIGAQFAVGAQYRLWKAFHIGVDGRFHLAAGETETTNSFGTVGGYLGIAF